MVGMVATNHARLSGTHLMAPVYVGNLVRWHLLADQGLDAKPDVVGGQAYFVADENEQTQSMDDFFDMLTEAIGVKKASVINPAMIFTAYMMPVLDWLLCGYFGNPIFASSPSTIKYSLVEGRFDIGKGIKDLGYTTRYDKGAVKQIIGDFYNKKH